MMTLSELAEILTLADFKTRNLLDVPTEALMEETKLQAQSMIGQEHEKWAPLAESTVVEKQRLGYTGQVSSTDPLLRTGELRESIRAEAELAIDGAVGIVGSDDKVAVFQEMGTSKIPPRPFLALAMGETYATAERLYGEFAVKMLTSIR